MIIDEFSNSASSSKCPVTSKYFTKESDPDDSLKEFQEKKKNTTGPKNSRKNAPKKKPIKRIKGQKDIRKLINKKNDLVAYTKDFDHMCKQSGVDVDSEQLQLAITLSKSIQDTKSAEDIEPTKPLTSQERTNKIRKTLQEYGFRVPEIKNVTVKRQKQRNKNYKLLSTTDVEKQAKITERYLHVLKQNDNYFKSDTDIPKEFLYYKSTCIAYDDMKNDNVFYVKSLIERPFSRTNLLRDWSSIPGRCLSPVFEGPKVSFIDIECSQDELDLVLSGSILSSQELLQKKLYNIKEKDLITNGNSYLSILPDEQNNMSSNILVDETLSLSTPNIVLDSSNLELQPVVQTHTQKMGKINVLVNETLSQQLETENVCYLQSSEFNGVHMDGTIDEMTENNLVEENNSEFTSEMHERSQSPDLFDDEVSCIMSLSKSQKPCSVATINNDTIDLTQCVPTTITLQAPNVTRKISNDFMEITECVVGKCVKDDEIDLTQNSDNDSTIHYDYDENVLAGTNMNDPDVEIVDLQENNSLTQKSIGNINDVSETLDSPILNFKDDESMPEALDLTQSSDSNELPDVKIISTSKTVSLDETIVINDDCSIFESKATVDKNHLNLLSISKNVGNCSNKASEFPDNVEVIEDADGINKVDTRIEDNIDLTQDLHITETNYNEDHLNSNVSNNLGAIDDLLIDNDEMFDNIIENYSNVSKLSKSKRSNEASTSFQSELFEVSDKELNYSISRCGYNPQNSDDVQENRDSDAFDELPSVNIENVEIVTPIKGNQDFDTIKTPGNNEYIIKMANVTPMQNFEAMSSPERNKELDKYGVKPLKRKRAIEILTYIYNQTHPIVESCITESPSKRLKITTSPRRTPKTSKSLNNSLEKENCIYLQTDEVPIIKDIACNHEDWIFQKREKAKIHSCRVPLHIAFHNYVSCRRQLRESILRYEPINIDVIHKGLNTDGYKYNPKDLLKFMDKKCITVKTADNNSRNRK